MQIRLLRRANLFVDGRSQKRRRRIYIGLVCLLIWENCLAKTTFFSGFSTPGWDQVINLPGQQPPGQGCNQTAPILRARAKNALHFRSVNLFATQWSKNAVTCKLKMKVMRHTWSCSNQVKYNVNHNKGSSSGAQQATFSLQIFGWQATSTIPLGRKKREYSVCNRLCMATSTIS